MIQINRFIKKMIKIAMPHRHMPALYTCSIKCCVILCHCGPIICRSCLAYHSCVLQFMNIHQNCPQNAKLVKELTDSLNNAHLSVDLILLRSFAIQILIYLSCIQDKRQQCKLLGYIVF